jgi:hypothetical protein
MVQTRSTVTKMEAHTVLSPVIPPCLNERGRGGEGGGRGKRGGGKRTRRGRNEALEYIVYGVYGVSHNTHTHTPHIAEYAPSSSIHSSHVVLECHHPQLGTKHVGDGEQ